MEEKFSKIKVKKAENKILKEEVIKKMKQRKGFTLIELMIVIAIIIILAAIAIPNYLRMTDRARRSRIAGDFTALATALEAYSVDWGAYPVAATADAFGKPIDGTTITSTIAKELTGQGGTQNVSTSTTLTGEQGGIEYIKAGTIQAMYNPFIPTADDDTDCYFYGSADGTHWVLYVQIDTSPGTYLWKTDMTTDLTEDSTAPSVP